MMGPGGSFHRYADLSLRPGILYYVPDHLGSTIAIVDVSAAVETRHHDPFGRPLLSIPSFSTPPIDASFPVSVESDSGTGEQLPLPVFQRAGFAYLGSRHGSG